MQSILKKTQFESRNNVMEKVQVEGTIRSEIGSRTAKEARNAGLVPCVVYGQDGTQHFTTDPKQLKSLIYTPDFKLVELVIDGKTKSAIIKDIQFHPVLGQVQHVDFLQLTEGVPVKVDIPLSSKGLSEGVKVGGKLIQQLRKITVKVTPENIVDRLYVDISNLGLGHSARVRDVEVNENMIVMNPGATPVVMVEIPRALRSATAAAEEAAEKV